MTKLVTFLYLLVGTAFTAFLGVLSFLAFAHEASHDPIAFKIRMVFLMAIGVFGTVFMLYHVYGEQRKK